MKRAQQTIAPKVDAQQAKKSRLVPPEARRRAAYSCDRCKSKKIRCQRVAGDEQPLLQDRTHPCVSCVRWDLECITTVPRRRRVYASFENLGTHYQTVIQLVQGLYPDVDINDVNALARLGASLGIQMGDGAGDGLRSIEVESKILKPFTPTAMEHSAWSNQAGPTPASTSTASAGSTSHNGTQYPPQKTQETMVYDASGGTHYVGSSGTPSLFTLLCNLLLKRSLVSTLSFDNKITLFRNGPDRKADYKETYVSLLRAPGFPLLRLIAHKETADSVVLLFFRKVHPFYFIFDQDEFVRLHDLYWALLLADEPAKAPHKELSSIAMGCIYLVYLIGSKMLDSAAAQELDSSRIEEVLQLILTDACLGASVASIQFLYLYAAHLHSEKNRDASWNLIGLAIRQATSLGLHKNVAQVENKHIQSQLFWSLYQTEMSLCLNFGRQSIINESEVDIAYPDLSHSQTLTPAFIQFHRCSIQLSRFMSQVVKERRITQQPLALINIERTLSMKAQLLKLHEELQIKPFTQIENLFDFKLSLMFYHYMASICLPIIVYVTTTNFKIREDETILGIVKVGVQAAVIISKILGEAASSEDNFHNGAISSDCMMGYNTALLLSLFFIYLCNTSNDLWDIDIDCEGTLEKIDKTATLMHISQVSVFMEKSKLDPTTKRIAEITQGLRNDLNIVALQEDVRFDMVDFEGADQLVYDSLVFNNDIYLDGWF